MFWILAQDAPPITFDYWESRGVMGALLFIAGIVLWRLYVRLFDDEKGYATKVVGRHITFMDKATEATERTVELTERQTIAVEKLTASETDCRQHHAKTMRALHHLAEGAKHSTPDQKAKESFTEAQRELR